MAKESGNIGASISVITVTYQAESVLRPTLESVLSQEYPNVEHLIIDGASADGTVVIANEYKEQNSLRNNGHVVRIVSEPDKGLYDAMNKGLRMVTGDYVLFLNAGDRLADSDTLRLVAEAAVAADGEPMPSVIYGDTDVYDAVGRYVGPRHLSVPEVLTWRSFQQGMLVCHQAFYALTAIACQLPYDARYRLSADVDWCIRVMREGERQGRHTHNVNAVICHYLEGGMSIKNHRASLIERFRIMSKYYGFLPTVFRHCWFVVRKLVKRKP